MESIQNKVVFLFGPTAVGKTALLFNVFSEGFEVINADSVQVYRHLDIGSAKATEEEQRRIPHHLIDIRQPWEDFTVGDFVNLADEASLDIRKRKKIPVVCGGTAYYFKHFLYGLSKSPKSDPETRATVQAMLEEKGGGYCHELLGRLDPISAQRIHPNDTYRVTRALEVCIATSGRLSDYAIPTTVRDGMQVLCIGLLRDKAEIDERIRKRVDIMFDQGLEEEVHSLIKMGATKAWPSMKAIGYQEFLEGQADTSAIKQKIIMNSIHYAKRQRVFFQSFSNVIWINPTEENLIRDQLSEFLELK